MIKTYSTVDEDSNVFLRENILDFVNDMFSVLAWAFIGFCEHDFQDLGIFIGLKQLFKGGI